MHAHFLLACGSGLSETEWDLVLLTLVLWVAGGLLTLANICLALFFGDQRKVWRHFFLLLFYVGWAITLVCGWAPHSIMRSNLIRLGYMNIPPLFAIGHFVFLLRDWRARKPKTDNNGAEVKTS